MLPASAAAPKEMLPVLDKPLLDYAVEECIEAGIEEIAVVLSPGKESIREYFEGTSHVATTLGDRGDDRAAIALRGSTLARFTFTEQREPRGIAHAVATTRAFVGLEPFALLFPDDIIFAIPSTVAQLAARHAETEGSVIAVQEVPPDQVENYGIADTSPERDWRIAGLVEKPALANAPSRFGIVGRYVLTNSIFGHIERLQPGRGGEYQITDAIAAQISAGEPVHALPFVGDRYDTGRPGGYLEAFVAAALRRPDLADSVAAIRAMLRMTGEAS
jgi:UTP--glucose-1-phosphate uridylyltransferase